MRRAALIFLLWLLLPSLCFAQLGYKRGFIPALGLFPSSGSSCTLQNSLSDSNRKDKIYWWECPVNASTNARLSVLGYLPLSSNNYTITGAMIRIKNTPAANAQICATFTSAQYFSRGALQVNQTGTDWRNTTWIGGTLPGSAEATITANTTPWLFLAPAAGGLPWSLVDVTNTAPSPTGNAGEIVVREVVIGRCSQFCGATNPPSCCPSSCNNYSGTVEIHGVNSY